MNLFFRNRAWLVSMCILSLVALWVALVSHWHTALHHDMAEQFVWAHSWQLGYPKHPPLPTWLFMSALLVWPAKPVTLYALSALCIGLAGVFTYLAARELLDERLALCVACLWGLQQPFSWRAWIYNHNTVLVMTVALTLFCTARASRLNSTRWWGAAGVCAGLAMSTKLQAAVPLAGMVWALWRSGSLASIASRKGLALSVMLAAAVSSPPLLWMATGHTNALAYATHQLGSGEGQGESLRLGQFVASELRMLWPTLSVLLAWVVWARRLSPSGPPSPRDAALASAHARAWVEGLLILPLVFVLAMGLLGGAKLHAQWGVQTFQFVSFALVVWFASFFDNLADSKLIRVVVVVQGLGLLLTLSPVSARLHAQGAVQGYPAQELANRVQSAWQKYSPNCALAYVDAPFFEGGQLSAFLPGSPAVLDDGPISNSPWIDLGNMGARGSVVLRYHVADLPPDAIHESDMALSPPPGVKGVGPIVWGIRPSRAPCPPIRQGAMGE
jgi:4-amino-4-deoxy-L-arabinose transferase-like glycosyltransferase